MWHDYQLKFLFLGLDSAITSRFLNEIQQYKFSCDFENRAYKNGFTEKRVPRKQRVYALMLRIPRSDTSFVSKSTTRHVLRFIWKKKNSKLSSRKK